MELIVSVAFVTFGLIFIAFIFIKSAIDSKKGKALMTEIFRKYGVKTNAKILSFKENESYGRNGIQGKFNFNIEFQYSSKENKTVTCSYTLPTNNSNCKKFIDSIPIIYIPAYMDYYMGLMKCEEFFSSIGHKLNLGYDCWLVIFSEDISFFTNLTEI